jgi:hypothetical protein
MKQIYLSKFAFVTKILSIKTMKLTFAGPDYCHKAVPEIVY